MGAVLRSFADIGYGGAYRILDARYFGVAQRRRRVFAVFEPRSATSRRKVFQNDYVEAFLNADQVILMKPFDQSKIGAFSKFIGSWFRRQHKYYAF